MKPAWSFPLSRFLVFAALVVFLGKSATGANFTVDIFNNFFQPDNITVNVGDTVTWVQRGFNHSTESTTINPATGRLYWQSAILASGQTFSFTFNVAPGNYPYRCFPHRTFMFGNVTVVAPPNDRPVVSISNPQNGAPFSAGSSVAVDADATDNDGIRQVEFFMNGNSAAIDTTFPYGTVLANLSTGNYALTAVATDVRGLSQTSAVVNISVSQPTAAPIVTSPPQSVVTNAGSQVTFQVVATGDPPVSYQWYHGNTPIPGQTGVTLVLDNVQAGDDGDYSVVVTNPGGSVTGGPATLTVVIPSVSIIAPADGATFGLGKPVTVTAAVSGVPIKVEFFVRPEGAANLVSIGAVTSPPFETTWIPSAAGDYHLSAVVSDTFGSYASLQDVLVHIIDDAGIPVLTITGSPPNFSRVPGPIVTLTGTASDENLLRVEYSLNRGPFQPAVGTDSWSAEIPLVGGTNRIAVRAVDLAGNVSLEAERIFILVVRSALTVQTDGAGTVIPNLNGRELEVGRAYRIAAIPGPGQIFAGWSGVENSNRAVLVFLMQTNLALAAHFVPDPFAPARGNYNGLVFDTGNVIPASSGFIRLSVSSRGTFSGLLVLNSRSFPFSGRLDYRGEAAIPILRRPLGPVLLELHANLAPPINVIRGTVTDGTWISSFDAERAALLAQTHGFLANPFLEFVPVNGRTNTLTLRLFRMGSTGLLTFQTADGPLKYFSVPAFATEGADVPVYFPALPDPTALMGWARLVFRITSTGSGSEALPPPPPIPNPPSP